jgi:hypothetical protein
MTPDGSFFGPFQDPRKNVDKRATARPNPHQVLARDGDRGSGTESLTRKTPDARCASAALLGTEKTPIVCERPET